jgi:hypothetical protein
VPLASQPVSRSDLQSGSDQDPSSTSAAVAAAGTAGAGDAALCKAFHSQWACIHLRYFQRLLALPEEDAWQLLQQVELPGGDADLALDSSDASSRIERAEQAFIAQAQAQHQQPPPLSHIYADVEAAEQDDDDAVYEDMFTAATATSTSSSPACNGSTPSRSQHTSHSSSTGTGSSTAAPYSWEQLKAKLLLISSGVAYSALEGSSIWQDPSTFSSLLQVLRAIGVHRHGEELQPALHVYLNLLTDHIAACHADIQQLSDLWEALGVQAVASAPRILVMSTTAAGNGASSGSTGGGSMVLPSEARLAFSVAATLAGQLQGHGARAKLWHQVNSHLLPALVRCTEELARLRAPQGDTLADILLVASVMVFYVTSSPAPATGAKALLQAGGIRALVQLFISHAALPAAEPLRRALLYACAASKEVAAWVQAVPAFGKALAAATSPGSGSTDLDGALWQLVLQPGSDSPALCSMLASWGAADTLEQLLAGLQALELLHRAAGKLWGPATAQQLQQLHAALLHKDDKAGDSSSSSRGGGGGGGGSARGQGSSSASAIAGASFYPDPAGHVLQVQQQSDLDDKQHLCSKEEYARRRTKQVVPMCIKLLKSLVNSDGKTD